MPYIGNTPALDYISFAVQNFTVTDGTTVYTLDYSVSNENDIALYINSVAQRPGASFAYSATGTTLTLTSATLATDTMYAVFIGRAVQTVTPPASSITNTMLAPSVITGQTAETSVAGGDLVLIYDDSASALRKMTKTNLFSGVDNTPAFAAKNTGTQTIADNTDTKLVFDTVVWDTDSAYSTVNNRFTVPTGKGGKYFFHAHAQVPGIDDAEIGQLLFLINGNDDLLTNVRENFSSTDQIFRMSMVHTVSLSSGDYVEVSFYQNSGGSQNGTNLYFSGYKLIGV
jgi:hypothetical protein